MDSKNRIKKLLQFEEPDRVGISDGFWVETIERWQKEGLPPNIPIYDYFDIDCWWIMFEQRFGFDEKIIEDNPEYIIMQHIDGGVFKIYKKAKHFTNDDMDMPGIPVDYMIKSEKDWKKYKHKFVPDKWRLAYKPKFSPEYGTTKKSLTELKTFYNNLKKDKFIFFGARAQTENIRSKLGTENFLLQIAINPKWIMEMFEADLNLTLEIYKMFSNLDIKFDGFWAFGDIAYKSGGFFSPLTYKKILRPFHKKLFSFFKEKNMPVVYHSDGNVNEFLPLLIDDGITAIQPLEVKAGMDAIKLKKKYGKDLALIGNIDVRVMAEGKEEIRSEIASKIPILKKGGGYIYHSDHSVPQNVSLENYKFLINCVKEFGNYYC